MLKRNVDCCSNQEAFPILNELRQSKSKTRVNTLHVELERPLGFGAFMFIAKEEQENRMPRTSTIGRDDTFVRILYSLLFIGLIFSE